MISFAYPLLLLLSLLVVPLLVLRRRRQTAFGHSQVALYKNLRTFSLGWLTTLFFAAAWIALCAAFARPLLPEVLEHRTIETRDIIIATDISGSMWSNITDPDQQKFAANQQAQPSPGASPGATPQPLRRIDVAQEAIKVFVERRQGDRVALMVFDDDTFCWWPLSDDLKIILRKSQRLNQRQGNGTNFNGPNDDVSGTGPIQASINHFIDYGKAKTRVFVMVTDGEDSFHQRRFNELSQQIDSLGIHMYVLGVGESWIDGSDLDLRRFVRRVGGTVIPVGNAAQMRAGFDTIDNMEKSQVVLTRSTNYKDIYPWFIAASLLFFVAYLACSAILHEDA